jgi:membrane protease YdiL (CAAX protease family)
MPMRGRSARHVVVSAIPAAVPLTMTVVFDLLRRRTTARAAYNSGFLVYWLGWCLAVPMWLLGPREAARLLVTGRPLPRVHLVLLAIPVAGAVGAELIPHRRQIDVPTAAVMAATAAVNAAGEELLWRGVFIRDPGSRRSMTMVWSLIGFALWHFAPQRVLPSRMGRWRFVAASAAVGITSTLAAQKSGGLRQVVVAHALADACGVTAARFRLGNHP